jgi:hypothetical protein
MRRSDFRRIRVASLKVYHPYLRVSGAVRLALLTELAVPLRQPAFEEGQGEIMTRKISLIIGALAVFVLSLTLGNITARRRATRQRSPAP